MNLTQQQRQREKYRKAGLSPEGRKINPKHFKYRWKNSDHFKNKRETKEKELKDILKNWNGENKTCKSCKKSFPLTDEFWVKNGKKSNGTQRYRTECGEKGNNCHGKNSEGGAGFKSSAAYKKTQKDQVLQNLITKNKNEDVKKGMICDLDMEWMIEQEQKGSADAIVEYGIEYLPFSYENIGHNLSNPMGPSIDRIDSTIAHTKDNCQMIWRKNHLGWKNTPPEWREKTYEVLKESRSK